MRADLQRRSTRQGGPNPVRTSASDSASRTASRPESCSKTLREHLFYVLLAPRQKIMPLGEDLRQGAALLGADKQGLDSNLSIMISMLGKSAMGFVTTA